MFAIISVNNNQVRVEPDKEYRFDLLEQKEGGITFDQVLLISDDKDNVTVGTPTIPEAKVEAEILGSLKEDKINVLKFHSKARYQRAFGSRAQKTLVKIKSIKI